jgi:hypothetical protein
MYILRKIARGSVPGGGRRESGSGGGEYLLILRCNCKSSGDNRDMLPKWVWGLSGEDSLVSKLQLADRGAGVADVGYAG